MFLATISSLAAVQLTVQNMGNHSNKKTLRGKKCFWAKNSDKNRISRRADSWENKAVSSPWDYIRGHFPHQPPPRLPEKTAHGSSYLRSLLDNSELLWLTHKRSRVVALLHHLPPPPPLHTRKSHSIISTILKKKVNKIQIQIHNKRLPIITDQVAWHTDNFWYLLCRFIVQVVFWTRVWRP